MSQLMGKDDLIVVTGGGGFIGGHVVADLLRRGYGPIRSVDVKPVDDWYQAFPEVENVQLDLREKAACYQAASGARFIFNFAADMGGMGFIETHKADCMLSVLIDTNMLLAARDRGAERFFYSSSACVYAADKQDQRRGPPVEGVRRVSRDAGGRIWLAEAVQRADVPPFLRGLRVGDAGRALSQRVRPPRCL